MKYHFIIGLFFFSISGIIKAQVIENELVIVQDSLPTTEIDALSPARAAFYSAFLPGLGQAYNKKYWKIPIVYAGLGIGVAVYLNNDRQYKDIRNAYKNRLEGVPDNYAEYSTATLINAQRTLQRNRDLSLLITVGIYVLNIIDANVDAHLLQFNVSEKLSVKPDIYQNDINSRHNVGLALNFRF